MLSRRSLQAVQSTPSSYCLSTPSCPDQVQVHSEGLDSILSQDHLGVTLSHTAELAKTPDRFD